jgi:hypothetical protein
LPAFSGIFGEIARFWANFAVQTSADRWPILDSYLLEARLKAHQVPAGRGNHRNAEAGSSICLGATGGLREIVK